MPSSPHARLVAVAVVVLTLVAYAPVRMAEYVQDDRVAVETNPVVARGDLSEIFTSSYWKGTEGDDRSLYRPVVILSYALERRVTAGPSSALSHGVNLALHGAAGLLLLSLALTIGAGLPAAAAASLLFALHPGHSEAVLGVVGRAELLAAVFTLIALRVHAGVPKTSLSRKRLAAWGAGAMVFLGLGSKEVAITAPFLMLAMDVLFRLREAGRVRPWLLDRAGALYPSALAVLAYLGLRTYALEAFPALQRVHPADNYLVLLQGGARVASALSVALRWALTLLVPARLSADWSGYSIPRQDSLLSPPALLGLLFVLAIAALAAAPAVRRSPPSSTLRLQSFSALLLCLSYLVVSNLPVHVGAIFAERFTYLPSAGFCLLLGLAYGRLRGGGDAAPRRRRIATAALAAVLLAYGGRTWARAVEWRTDETVFASAVEATPQSPRAHFIVGKGLEDRGRSAEALRHFDEALRLWPTHVPARYEKGGLLGRTGDLAGAEAALREVLRINPAYGAAHYNLGHALHLMKRLDEAERSLRKAVLWDPAHATAWAELGHVRFETRRYAAAAEAYARALAEGREDLKPRLEEARRLARGTD